MPLTIDLSTYLEHLTAALGISYDELAHVVGTDRKTIYRWLAKESFPQTANRAALDALEALALRLDETFDGPEGTHTWLRSRSGYFGGLCPLDALLRGRIDAVSAALDALDAGVFV
jgi:transcriptional regulator with XRE-family HTH domain